MLELKLPPTQDVETCKDRHKWGSPMLAQGLINFSFDNNKKMLKILMILSSKCTGSKILHHSICQNSNVSPIFNKQDKMQLKKEMVHSKKISPNQSRRRYHQD